MRLWMCALVGGFCMFLLIGAVSAGRAVAETEDWSLDKQKNGIDVYTRPVADSGIKEFKGVAEVAAGVAVILAVLRDSDRFKTWFPNTSESSLLGREDDVSYQYSVMTAPWPVSDRDNILRSVSTHNNETGVVVITLNAVPDYHPEAEGRVRVQRARGSWKLEPLAANRTNVTFTMHLEPGGGIPQWLINTRIVATPFDALTNLRTTVEKPTGR